MAASSKSWLQKFKESESSTSIIFGAIVVVIVGILLFNYSRSANPASISESGEATESAQNAPNGITLPTTHQVGSGETLWSISDKYYGTGEKWPEIVDENKLSKTGDVNAGQILNIPLTNVLKSNSKSYTVVSGDCLWDIAVATYGDGYRWTDIYQANQSLINNPDLIYPGQVLVLP